MKMTSKDYVAYLKIVAKKLEENKDYITELDAATGDGDHWANMNMGFVKLMELSPELETLSIPDLFKKIAMTMMSVIGGSAGVLYGSAYMKAAAVSQGAESIDLDLLAKIVQAQLDGIMSRGKAQPGFKTMVDSLYQAQQRMEEAMKAGKSEKEVLTAMKEGAVAGMEATANMEAMRGRACYQADKGVGHLDPGAVTMCYQLETLADFLLQ